MKPKTAYILRHLSFEDLGSLESVLLNNHYVTRYFEMGVDDIEWMLHHQPDLLVILGGPIAVYANHDYPFLNTELQILQKRLSADLPTIGICLGAQLIAAALGARVYFGGQKEIGWSGLQLTESAKKGVFKHLDGEHVQVLHWHGDTYDLPKGAVLQASTALYPNQAFTYQQNTLALQFHPEVIGSQMEKWFIGHAGEIAQAKISVAKLREDTALHAPKLLVQARAFFEEWVGGLSLKGRPAVHCH